MLIFQVQKLKIIFRVELEQDCELWRELCSEQDRVLALLERCVFTDDPVNSLAGVQFNIQKLTAAIADVTHQTPVLKLFLERCRELSAKADASNKVKLEADAQDIQNKWNHLLSKYV